MKIVRRRLHSQHFCADIPKPIDPPHLETQPVARRGRIVDITLMQHDRHRSAFYNSTAFRCLILLALAMTVRAVGLGFGLPHALARPDEETIVGNVLNLEDSPDWNPRFFSYPSLMIYTSYGLFKVMLALMRFAGDTDAATLRALFLENPACFHWTIRLFSLVCGSFTPLVVFAAARRLYGKQVGWLSGLILALCYLHVRDSHFGVTDVPFVFLVCLSFWQLTKLYRGGAMTNLVGASLFAGLAIGMKYTGVWLCWPFAVAIIHGIRRLPNRQRSIRFAVMCGCALAMTLAVFALSSPYFFLDFSRAWDDFLWEMVLVNQEAPIAPGINGYLHHFAVSLWYGLGWPVLLAALASGVVMAVRRSGKALLLWSLPVLFYAYSGLSNRIFIRYMDLVLPFLAIACGWGVRSLFLWLRATRQQRGWNRRRDVCATIRSPRQQQWWPIAATILLLIPSMQRITLFDQRMTRRDTRLELRQWLLNNIPATEPILWSGGWSAMPHMIHHLPIRILHATEKVLPKQPEAVPRYRWIILVQWPVAYYLMGNRQADQERAYVIQQMGDRYELIYEIDAYKTDLPPELFSRLDHFYMSFAQPGIIDRPGPGYLIYHRIDD